MKKKRKTFPAAQIPLLQEITSFFWKKVKPSFSNKGNLGPNIKLVEKNDLPQNHRKVANELNNFFKNTVPKLEINENR